LVSNKKWVGNSALEGTGDNDYIETGTWRNFGSNMPSGFSVFFTIQRTSSTQGYIISTRNQIDNNSLWVGYGQSEASGDELSLGIEDNSGNWLRQYVENGEFDTTDGEKYRVVWIVNGVTENNDYSVYINGTEYNVTVGDNQSPNTNDFENFDNNVILLAAFNDGVIERHLDGTVDNIVVTNKPVSEEKIKKDYNSQPWS